MIEYAIVIPTYKNEDLTITCLKSIKQNTSEEYKIIWVDDASGKTSRQKVKTFLENNNFQYELILNDKNEGFIKSVNKGLKRAMDLNAQFVILQNNDTEVAAEWLTRMRHVMDVDDKIGIVGPLASPGYGWQSIRHVGKYYDGISGISEHKYNKQLFVDYANYIAKKNNKKFKYVYNMVAFFSVMIRRDVIAKIGFLDERYGIGFYDDNDYCQSALRAGFEIALSCDVLVKHEHSKTFDKKFSEEKCDEKKKLLQEKNKKLFEKKFQYGKYDVHPYSIDEQRLLQIRLLYKMSEQRLLQIKVEDLEKQINVMENSFFWKLRNKYLVVKKLFI